MLGDITPKVRAEAARTLGALGSASALSRLEPLLRDPDPSVRQATGHAVAHLGQRTERPDLVRKWLTPLSSDASESVRNAIVEVLS